MNLVCTATIGNPEILFYGITDAFYIERAPTIIPSLAI